MKKVVTRIMAAFLTMTLILLNIPVTILADSPKFNKGPATEVQFSVLYDSDQVLVSGDDTHGCIRTYDKPSGKTAGAYGSVWLTITQHRVMEDGRIDHNQTAQEGKRIISAKLYEKRLEDKDKKEEELTPIAIFDTTNGVGKGELPNANEEGINISGDRYGCKVMIRPPLDGSLRTYYFVLKTEDNRDIRTGDITLQVRELEKPLLVPPTIGRTDGFSRTKSNASHESPVQVYAKEDIILDDGTKITKGDLLISILRDDDRLEAKQSELQAELEKLSDTQREKYARAIDYRSMDPAWEFNMSASQLAELRVSRESIQFITPMDDDKVLVAYDRNYIAEIQEILATNQDVVYYKSMVEASVEYLGLSKGFSPSEAGYKDLQDAINRSDGKDLLIVVSTEQNAHFEDAATKDAVDNEYLWNNIYAGESVIKYTKNVHEFFTSVKLNIVAMYMGKPGSKSESYTNKNVRAFIFTNQSGVGAGSWFKDAPIPDVRVQEIPEWSQMFTEIRKHDNQLKVAYNTTTLHLYPDEVNMNRETLIAARNKNTFIGVDSVVDTYGGMGKYYIDGDKPYPDSNYYDTYYKDFVVNNRFYPGTSVFTPTGKVGEQIGYRIVYEEYLLNKAIETVKEMKDATDKMGALNALILMDTDAFKEFTGKELTQQQLNNYLYEMISGASAMAEEFMIDSVQDFTPLAAVPSGGAPKYTFGVGTSDLNYIIPDNRSCLSYIIKIDDARLIDTSKLQESKITTTIDLSELNAKDEVYSEGSGYVSVKPEVIIDTLDTSAFQFEVEKFNEASGKYDYDSQLSATIAASKFEDGILTIQFDMKNDKYFPEVGEYRVSVMFPVTLPGGLTVKKYRFGEGTDKHLPVIKDGIGFPRKRLVDTKTIAYYKENDKYDPLTKVSIPATPVTLDPVEQRLELQYNDFVKIQ